MKYKVKGYKLVCYEAIDMLVKSKKETNKKLAKLDKQGKLKVKSENYLSEVEIVK